MTKHRRPRTEATIFLPHLMVRAGSQQAQISPANPSLLMPQDSKIDRFETVSASTKLQQATGAISGYITNLRATRCSDLRFPDDCDRGHEPVMLHNNNLPRIFAAAQHLDTPAVLSEHPGHSW
jgi:hypothetical protein